MSVRSSGVMQIKELHLREFASGGREREGRGRGRIPLGDRSVQLPEGLARARICAIFLYGCRFPSQLLFAGDAGARGKVLRHLRGFWRRQRGRPLAL
jgi:hypothetical protein